MSEGSHWRPPPPLVRMESSTSTQNMWCLEPEMPVDDTYIVTGLTASTGTTKPHSSSTCRTLRIPFFPAVEYLINPACAATTYPLPLSSPLSP